MDAITELALELLRGTFWVQGCSTGGKPSADNRSAITMIVEGVDARQISVDDVDEAQADERDAITNDEWEALTNDERAKRVAANAIRIAGERAASLAGYDTDGYSCEITF